MIKWKNGTSWKVAASVAHEVIEDVRKKNDGDVSAESVVAVAKLKRNPLHNDFEWDDAIAAHEQRLETARRMMRSFVVVRNDLKTDRPQRVYEVVKDQHAEPMRPGTRAKKVYRRVEDLMKDPDMRAELLGRALNELISIRNRYRDLQELAIVIRAIDETVEKLEA